MKTTHVAALSCWITGNVVHSFALVGTAPIIKTFDYWLPFQIFLFIAVSATLGYLIGRGK